MPSQRLIDLDVLRRRRHWRAQIARSRRRLGSHVRGVAREARALVNWRTYVRRFPAAAVISAAMVGLMFAHRRGRSTAARRTAPDEQSASRAAEGRRDDSRHAVGRGAGVWLLRELISGLSHLGVAWLSRELSARASAAQDAAFAAASARAATAAAGAGPASPPSAAQSSPPAAGKRTTQHRTRSTTPRSDEADT